VNEKEIESSDHFPQLPRSAFPQEREGANPRVRRNGSFAKHGHLMPIGGEESCVSFEYGFHASNFRKAVMEEPDLHTATGPGPASSSTMRYILLLIIVAAVYMVFVRASPTLQPTIKAVAEPKVTVNGLPQPESNVLKRPLARTHAVLDTASRSAAENGF
jgi:hypothetical protein